MNISATGIVIDHYGDVLMIQRDDTHTLAPPGGAAEIGELPPETVAREVREETGLIVMPVRLVGLYYTPTKTNDYLSLCFRCIMRGGELTTSDESPRAGFFKTNPYPKPMLSFHKERIQRSLAHQGGPPYWGTHSFSTRLRFGGFLLNRIIYPWLGFRRRQKGLPAYQPPPRWKTLVSVILRDKHGRILWNKSQEREEWFLPEEISLTHEPPWDTALRLIKNKQRTDVKLTGLSGIYPARAESIMAFTFLAEFASGYQEQKNGIELKFFDSGTEPQSVRKQHLSQVEDALKSDGEIQYRFMHLK